jgi:hypothetical protein
MKLHEVCKDALDKPTPTLDDLVKKYDLSKEELQSQLDMGIEVEFEHTSDKKVAKEIALDHLAEDPKYYDKLKKVEE